MGLSATALKRLEARRKGADLAATDGGLFQGRAGTLNLKSMQKNVAIKDRKGATHGPEVHLIGEIVGGSGFGPGVCCKPVEVKSQRKRACVAQLRPGCSLSLGAFFVIP